MLKYALTALVSFSLGLFAGPLIAPGPDVEAIEQENAQLKREYALMQMLIAELKAEREEVRAVLEGGQ